MVQLTTGYDERSLVIFKFGEMPFEVIEIYFIISGVYSIHYDVVESINASMGWALKLVKF
jgi:hypothetical protein